MSMSTGVNPYILSSWIHIYLQDFPQRSPKPKGRYPSMLPAPAPARNYALGTQVTMPVAAGLISLRGGMGRFGTRLHPSSSAWGWAAHPQLSLTPSHQRPSRPGPQGAWLEHASTRVPHQPMPWGLDVYLGGPDLICSAFGVLYFLP